MKNRLARFALLLVPLVLVAETRADSASIDAYLAEQIENTKIPGLVAMVTDAEGVLYTAALGWQDVGNGVPMADDSIFRIASMTKPVAAAAIMMLVEEGKLSLNDPIAKYIAEFADPAVIESFDPETGECSTRPANGEITIRQLLSHSSGLAYGFASDAIARISAGGGAGGARTQPLLYDPGTGWSYASGVTGPHDATDSRAPGSLSWVGIFNTEFWIDPASGIGGILLMQYLPFYDEDAVDTLVGFEQRVYDGLHSPDGLQPSGR